MSPEGPSIVVPVVGMGEGYVVVDKPAGLLSVPGKGADKADCVAARVAGMFPDASGPLIVHRLDMDTSGLMVLGLDAASQRDLSKQFERRTVGKTYVALLDGRVREAGDEGVIELPMRLDVDRRPHQIVDHERGREAVTAWRILGFEIEGGRECTRVELMPRTGRSHQLRVHAAEGIGAPILGDVLYGEGASAARLMLHATDLAFDEPGGGEDEPGARVRFESEAPF